jgi:PAS domain-containing protein
MYRLRHIEAEPAARKAVLTALADSPLPFTVEPVADPATPPPADGEPPVDALLLGTGGLADPLAAIGVCRHGFPDRPIILLTDVADLGFARAALRAGAQDVVQQHERALAVLSRILLYAIERAGAELRHRRLQAEAAELKALLDAVVARPFEGILQTDAVGTIERLSPAAAALLGTRLPPAPGAGLAEHVEPTDRARLAAFLAGAGTCGGEPAIFTFGPQGAKRQVEVAPIALAGTVEPAPRLFRLAALDAAFGVDEAPAAAIADEACQRRTAPSALDEAGQPGATPASGGSAGTEPTPSGRAAAAASVRRPAAHATPSGPPALGALAQLQALATTATWHGTTTSGGGGPFGVLACDAATAATLERLTAAARENVDLALACDTLRLNAWRDLAALCPAAVPERLLLDVSYTTAASRPHFERLLAAIHADAASLAGRFQLLLQGVPKGIHVPTLGKTIRAMGTSHGRPAVQLPDLNADYRPLVLGQLEVLVLTLADLKFALAHDAKALAAFLARSRSEGCRSLVRGATGPLAEALRNRLGIDMTVAA